MGTSGNNQSKIVAQCQQRITAIKQYVTGNTTVTLEGTAYNAQQIVAVYQASIDTRTAVTSQRTALTAAIAQRTQADALRETIDVALEHWVENSQGSKSQAMGVFGYAGPKSPPRTLKSKVVAADKAAATREARHTMGKNQKKQVKGELPAQAVSQPATPASKPTA
jgi:hypothetical protein